MKETIKKEMKVKVAQKPSGKTREPRKAKGKAKKLLPVFNFPLKQRSVRAKNLQEAIKKVNAKE